MPLTRPKTLIIAPHPDDEIIGCFSVLKLGRVSGIVYGSKQEEGGQITAELGIDNFSAIPTSLPQDSILYFPDPIYETHPDHRFWGSIGEQFVRKGYIVYFYSINMRAPYIFEVPNPLEKRTFLEKYYSGKKDLWEFDHRYFLFEGYLQWHSLKTMVG